MKEDIRNYLHLYSGCKVLIDGETLGTLVGISHTYDVELYVNNQWLHHRFCKLILRPLSNMTRKEEFEHLDNSKYGPYTPIEFKWLLSAGFDLFNLIPEGLAIDATTL